MFCSELDSGGLAKTNIKLKNVLSNILDILNNMFSRISWEIITRTQTVTVTVETTIRLTKTDRCRSSTSMVGGWPRNCGTDLQQLELAKWNAFVTDVSDKWCSLVICFL